MVWADSYAQRTNFDDLIPDLTYRSRDYQELLVQLAWLNNPSNKIKQSELKIAQIEKKAVKWDWADDMVLSFNFNEGNVSDFAPENSFFPRYNLSLSFSLGKMIRIHPNIKIKTQKVMIAEETLNQQKLYVKNEALRRFQEYSGKVELVKIRTQIAEDMNANFLLISKKFVNGETTLADYNEAANAYNSAIENRVVAEHEARIAKLTLEEFVGVELEEIFGGYENKKQ